VRKKLKEIFTEYGPIAVVVYLGLFFAVLFGFWGAIHLGWQPGSLTANVGTFTAAYLATKLTQGFRIAATLAFTPIVARVYSRVSGRAVVAPAPTPTHAPTPTPTEDQAG
jgi:hypothetical protein